MEFNDETLKNIAHWETKDVLIGVDIGATNTRVSVALDVKSGIFELYKFKCDTVATLISNFEVIGTKLASLGLTISAAALDVAGPVTVLSRKPLKQQVVITNWAGTVERTLTTDMLPHSLFPTGRVAMLNDLEAGCYGILALSEQGQLAKYFNPLTSSSEDNSKLAPKNYMVLAMGTGLGVGCLFYHNGKHVVIPMEVGHCLATSFGPNYPENKEDHELFDYISGMLYKGQHWCEFEDICSGRGLEWTYQFLTQNASSQPKLEASQISNGAMNGDKIAAKAMLIHYKMLIRAAQDASVATNSKGVILSGDNQVANKKFVFENNEYLKKEYLHHPKQHWISSNPILAQVEQVNTMLLGCVFRASEF